MAAERKWYQLSAEQVLSDLHTSRINGLTKEEAQDRIRQYSYNVFKKKKKKSAISIFFNQFKGFLIGLLIFAAIISVLIQHWIDASVIFAIIIINAILGFTQEYRAEKAIEALEKLAAPKARVIRNGREIKIHATELVPGDIVVLEQGDKVPADLRLIEAMNLKVDESALTGESVSVDKNLETIKKEAVIADRKNCVFMNTIITNGRAKGVIVETGMHSEIGKIAHMIETVEEKKTPLQEKLSGVAKTLGIAVLIISTAIFALGIFREGTSKLFDMFLTAVALAVAAVPEGLPAVITITLAIGLERLAKSKAIVKKLPAVETLGSCNIICTDKTGTLTKNEMTVRKLWVNNSEVDVLGEGYIPEGTFILDGNRFNPAQDKHGQLLLHVSALCNSASLYEENQQWRITGDPTEAALLVLAAKSGLYREELKRIYAHIGEFSFDAKRKRMSTIHKHDKGVIAFVKGAPDSILDICDYIYENEKVRKLTNSDRKRILDINEKFAQKSLRVLAMAYKHLPEKGAYPLEHVEKGLTFVGLAGMIDPPRAEAKEALKKCQEAGIKVQIVTGDHKATATAVARELGLVIGKEKTIEGKELDKWDRTDLEQNVDKVAIYARVSPQHKLKIVKALKKKNYIVAMTGDGVNDAPALKEANIGISMGLRGTDVAKEASDIILEDDNFATIVSAIENGRGIYDNIKKFVNYLLTSNIGEVLVIFIAVLIGWPLPLIAVQILWMNLLTDGMPAFALGVDPPEKNIIKKPPRNPKEKIISKDMKYAIILVSSLMCVGTLGLFGWELIKNSPLEKARTVVLATLIMFQMARVQAVRSEYDIKLFSNKWLILAIISSVILLLAIVYVPFLQSIFSTTNLALMDWVKILAVSLSVLVIVEIKKLISKK